MSCAGFFFIGLIASAGPLAPQPRPAARVPAAFGQIVGIVLDPEGKPVVGALVRAYTSGRHAEVIPSAYSGGDGAFTLTDVVPGTYWVAADKVEDGYPDPFSPLYGYAVSRLLPRVTVQANQVVKSVTVRLFPKIGRLIVRALDAQTNMPLKGGFWVAYRDGQPDSRAGESSFWPGGRFLILLPPVPCKIEVTAQGYAPWTYGQDDSPPQPRTLLVPAGDVKTLTIHLHAGR